MYSTPYQRAVARQNIRRLKITGQKFTLMESGKILMAAHMPEDETLMVSQADWEQLLEVGDVLAAAFGHCMIVGRGHTDWGVRFVPITRSVRFCEHRRHPVGPVDAFGRPSPILNLIDPAMPYHPARDNIILCSPTSGVRQGDTLLIAGQYRTVLDVTTDRCELLQAKLSPVPNIRNL